MSGAAPDRRLQTPFGTFELQRYPARPRETLQAWCAADSLLLEAVAEHFLDPSRPAPPPRPLSPMLVVNDEHGALAVALAAACTWTDSALSCLALAHNLARNALPSPAIVPSHETPPADAALVVLRVPKQLAFFEYQLATLAATLAPGTPLLVAGMDKHLSPHTAALIERYVGPTQRHPGRRKARLFSALTAGPREAVPGWSRYLCQPLGAELRALPNVFSRDRLDPGSALLLSRLGALEPAPRVIDLACGSGVLGLSALESGLAREVVFCDESAMALASARHNLARLRPGDLAACDFLQGDGLRDYRGAAADLVLCNPPFHLQHVVDDFAGRRLLAQAARHLRPEGRLCLVANRHLRYRAALERNFRRVKQLAGDRKFNVWLASAPRHGELGTDT
jgi:23S rRNA (guanine1835-N2)-methyltransferase